ncbi:hypothetical protein HAX54_001310 [Datura stramonium]|uniref:Uncharacterized protein n=1 Tax=Datura stramonium TaxID=4076 RepID=A0ABS8RU21_DATST|nr:hypothetical protein [Datura stramonium]
MKILHHLGQRNAPKTRALGNKFLLNFTPDVKDSQEKGLTFYGETDINMSKGEDTANENVNDVDDACDARTDETDELQYEKEVKECPEAELEHDKPTKCGQRCRVGPNRR